jgi:hypothetical protein
MMSEHRQNNFNGNDIDRIRKKTFNDELKDLVEKVIPENKSNSNSDQLIACNDSTDLTKKINSLFYKVINLSGQDSIYTGFNPFIPNNENIFEYAIKYIETSLSEIQVHEYSLLFYDHMYKSFTPDIFKIENYPKENVIIAPEDPIYNNIVDDPIGVLIEPSSEIRSKISKKHFINDFNNSTVFIISIQNLLNIFWSCCSLETPKLFSPSGLFPIFLAIFRNPEQFNHTLLIRVLQKKLTFAFYIINNHLRKDLIPVEFRPPSYLCTLIDTLGRIYGHIDNMRCFIIKHKGKYTNYSYITMSYIERKLYSLCGPNSSTLFLEKNKLIIYVSPEDYSNINDYLNEASSIFDSVFMVSEIHDFKNINLFSLLKE